MVTILTVAGLDISLFLRMNNFAMCLRFFTFVVASLRKHLIGKLHVVMTVLMISRDFLVTLNGHLARMQCPDSYHQCPTGRKPTAVSALHHSAMRDHPRSSGTTTTDRGARQFTGPGRFCDQR